MNNFTASKRSRAYSRHCNVAVILTTKEDSIAESDRGFASMDESKQKEIASKGGKASGASRSNNSNSSSSKSSGAAGSTEAAKRGGENSNRS